MIAGSFDQIATESARDHERPPDCSPEVSFPALGPAMITAKNGPVNDRGPEMGAIRRELATIMRMDLG
jgi:hypothetical protein